MFTRQPPNSKTINDIKGVDRTFERTLDALRPETGDVGGQRGGSQSGGGSSGGSRPIGSRQDGTLSIIGNDLTIVGQGLKIVTRGTLQVEGKIEGDVIGNEVIIGEKGHVTGVVSGQSVVVHGAVAGTVKGVHVALKSGARVDGDVLHHQLSVDQGAHLDGRVKRPADPSELTPVLD
jgi:cytoskeletal protein CcmA (bactofilin family)